jgi:hypothetical protein
MPRIASGLANELAAFIRKGGSVLFFPAKEADVSSYNSFFQSVEADLFSEPQEANRKIRSINTQEGVFKDVFVELEDNIRLPRTRFYYQVKSATRVNKETILTLDDGQPFLSKYKYGNGKIYVCSSPLDKEINELPLHAIFVPMIYKMGILSTGKISAPFTLTNDLNLVISENYDMAEGILKVKGEAVEFIPEQKSLGGNIVLNLGNQLMVSGAYEVLSPQGDIVQLAAVNYDRRESSMDFLSKEALSSRFGQDQIKIVDELKNVGQVIQEMDRGKSLWKLCVIFTLIFLAAEVLLLRFLPG